MNRLGNETLCAERHRERQHEKNGTDDRHNSRCPPLALRPFSSVESSGRHFGLQPSGSATASIALSRCKIVAFVMIGRAQKPTLRTHPKVTYRKATPARRPAKSPMRPMITGTDR